jgi:hypothetical protein
MMTHGAMLWGAALYNNGGYPLKDTRFGESYSETGAPQELWRVPQPSAQETKLKGILSFLQPLPRWEISQPGNILRVFERGGRRRVDVGLPDKDEDPGKPDKGLSPRGLGTNNRTDPVYLGLQNALARSDAQPSRNQRSSRRFPLKRLHRVPRRLCQRPRSRSLKHLRQTRQFRHNRNRRSEHSQKRIRTSDTPFFHQPHSIFAVHGLSHAPRHQHGRNLLRHDLVGQRNRRRKMYPAKQHTPSQDEEQVSSTATPKHRVCAAIGLMKDSFARQARPNSMRA